MMGESLAAGNALAVEVNSIPKGELFAMIAHSFELTAPKIPKAKK